MLLANYPPGAHLFPPGLVFQQLYRSACKATVYGRAVQPLVRKSLLAVIERGFESLFEELASASGERTAAALHFRRLRSLRVHLRDLRSYKTCLSCLLRSPEKVFDCGHALCDTCIKIYGKQSNAEKYTFAMTACILCGAAHHGPGFQMVPPTAGIRVLSLDGGGVRGVILLVFLDRMEQLLSDLRCPLRDFFDFVCGTLAGGLIVMGLFIMRWTSKECLEKFKGLAMKTFQRRNRGPVLLNRLRELVMSYWRDWQCSSFAIENAFFKPKDVEHLGIFQDGGLQFNNPMSIALWETRFIWPDKPEPDFALSIGTGMPEAARAAYAVGPQSPVKDRFFARIMRTFMRSLDGERAWKELNNTLPVEVRKRYHRLNFPLPGQEPSLDDVTIMHELKNRTLEHLKSDVQMQLVRDSLLSLMFYFEFDEFPQHKDGRYDCAGHIFCRLDLPHEGRKALYLELQATSSYFVVLGSPVPCVETIPKCTPPFKRRIRFDLLSLDEILGVTLRGITSQPQSISGLPRNAREIVKAQRLRSPFSRTDHVHPEKNLPSIPAKRKAEDCLQQGTWI
ncbi:hypothetical protein LTR66_012941 [Elasticomyces elasticus]|nr:hypothetical protein LTR66_012941 [Elasticomyces elasticus]